ncbi:MAG: amidase family protein, partial [Deltaproteobacteria bacterium]
MTAAEVARETGARLARAAADGLNATLHWSQDALNAEAARVDALPARGALHAVPVAVKDNIVTTDAPTTCASR